MIDSAAEYQLTEDSALAPIWPPTDNEWGSLFEEVFFLQLAIVLARKK